MGLDMIVGIIIGFIVSFLVLKRSINKTGYGELKLCRETCPYYKSNVTAKSDDDEEEDDD